MASSYFIRSDSFARSLLAVSLAARKYIIIVNWVLLQVSVAVLLDNFVRASVRIEEDEKAIIIGKRRNEAEIKNPLEPLLVHLIKVGTAVAYVFLAPLH